MFVFVWREHRGGVEEFTLSARREDKSLALAGRDESRGETDRRQ